MKWVTAALFRGVAFVGLWEVMSSWESDYALYGLVSVAAATALSLFLIPPGRRLRLRGVTVLAGWFLYQAVAGGIDVARRAVQATPDIDPAVRAHLHLPPGHGRELAMLLMNLMPGTMVQRRCGEEVELHTLSLTLEPVQQWHTLQELVAGAFGPDGFSGGRGRAGEGR